MRILPVAPFVARECEADTPLGDKCTIPKGAIIFLGIQDVHFNPNIWGPEPKKFNPENFTPEKMAERDTYDFLPFSGGPRNCVGKFHPNIVCYYLPFLILLTFL